MTLLHKKRKNLRQIIKKVKRDGALFLALNLKLCKSLSFLFIKRQAFAVEKAEKRRFFNCFNYTQLTLTNVKEVRSAKNPLIAL